MSASGPGVQTATRAERAARGKQARKRVPRASHAVWEARADRPDPLDLLEEQAANRVAELVPIRHGRMLVSPLTYFRGAALPMASDLALTPDSGVKVQLCGDAHMSNFGMFGSPERHLFFDVNDFDETAPGPWEWDVKRLAASIEIAGRENEFSDKERKADRARRGALLPRDDEAVVEYVGPWGVVRVPRHGQAGAALPFASRSQTDAECLARDQQGACT